MNKIMELDGKVFLATRIVAERYGINVNTVPVWVEKNLLPRPIRLGRNYYFDQERIDKMMSRGE